LHPRQVRWASPELLYLTLFPQGKPRAKGSFAQPTETNCSVNFILETSERNCRKKAMKGNKPMKIITNISYSAFALFAFASSALAQSLFCPSRLSNDVAVIDTSTNQVITHIPVGVFPIRIEMTPNRLKAFISNEHSNSISVLDTVARTNIATIPVDPRPGEMAVTPDGGRLFVVHQTNVPGDQRHCPVDVIDTATNLVITTLLINGDSAKDILITPDGRFAYIANASFPEVDVIDTATYQLTIIPAARTRRLCISPAGDRVYGTNYHEDTVSAIDTATKQLIATIPVGQFARPMGIAITPNGEEVYVTNQHAGTVSVIDTTTLTVIATIPTGAHCQRVVITRDGTKAFVQNGWSDTVSAIDTATHTVSATLPTGHQPWTILGSPDDMTLYVCNGSDTTVTVIDIPSLTVSDTIANVGSHPFDLEFGP
jgi:YVTN family beta-propeller protein